MPTLSSSTCHHQIKFEFLACLMTNYGIKISKMCSYWGKKERSINIQRPALVSRPSPWCTDPVCLMGTPAVFGKAFQRHGRSSIYPCRCVWAACTSAATAPRGFLLPTRQFSTWPTHYLFDEYIRFIWDYLDFKTDTVGLCTTISLQTRLINMNYLPPLQVHNTISLNIN